VTPLKFHGGDHWRQKKGVLRLS